MSLARIYQPDKNAMQSGQATEGWKLEYVPATPYFTDDLMGWTGMTDMLRELHLTFPTLEEAENYAKKQNIAYEIELPNVRHQVKKAYADNFAYKKTN